MRILILAAMMLTILGSCSRSSNGQPREIEDACSILNERPHYVRAFRNAKRTWGVEPHIMMAMIYQESKFVSDIRPPHRYAIGVIPIGRQSSALGYSQALDGTWDEYLQEQGKRGAKREDINAATDFMGWYMTKTVEATGVPLNDVRRQYLAYHDGRSGYLRGTWRSKTWLIRIADEMVVRASRYQTQLASCRKARF